MSKRLKMPVHCPCIKSSDTWASVASKVCLQIWFLEPFAVLLQLSLRAGCFQADFSCIEDILSDDISSDATLFQTSGWERLLFLQAKSVVNICKVLQLVRGIFPSEEWRKDEVGFIALRLKPKLW